MDDYTLATLHPGYLPDFYLESLRILDHSDVKPRRVMMKKGKKLELDKNRMTNEWFEEGADDWLLWVDSDFVWKPWDVKALLREGVHRGPGVYCGLWFHWSRAMGIYPGVFTQDNTSKLLIDLQWEPPESKSVKVEGTGGGFMLIHRKVFEDILDYRPLHDASRPFFYSARTPEGYTGYSEYFFQQVKRAGHDCWLVPKSQPLHVEQIPISRELWEVAR